MWMEVKRSSRTRRSLITMASSKLPPSQLMKATSTFWPSASSPCSVDELSAMTCPASTYWPLRTIGRWLIQVPAFERTNLLRWWMCTSGEVKGSSLEDTSPTPLSRLDCVSGEVKGSISILRAVTESTSPLTGLTTTWPESTATCRSMPVPQMGEWGRSKGTAWRCMLAPISARFTSSCSRKGISALATPTVCCGDTSM